jgi:1,4-dihydroxy-2-naphthoate octaprenyltransferase
MRFTVLLLLAGLTIAVLVYVATGGHVLFLPLILIFPLGLFFSRRALKSQTPPDREST